VLPVKVALTRTAIIMTHTMARELPKKSLHEAVGAERIRHLATAMTLRALKAEPAHVVGNKCTRHTDISPATLSMAVKLATLRQKKDGSPVTIILPREDVFRFVRSERTNHVRVNIMTFSIIIIRQIPHPCR
jgi:hypothetical protein